MSTQARGRIDRRNHFEAGDSRPDRRWSGRVRGLGSSGSTSADVLVGRHRQRLVRFGMVGASGTVVNLAALFVLAGVVRLPHLPAAGVATEAAVLNNFWWNDRWTFRHTQPRLALARRLGSYHLVALGGTLVALALFMLLETELGWDYLLADAVGITAGVAFNYLASTRYTWATSTHPGRFR